MLSGAKAVEVWSIEKAGVIKTIPCEAKPTSLCWLDENNLLIGLNDGKLIWDHLEKKEVRCHCCLFSVKVVKMLNFEF